jgi:YidC/Oxa1 family membrane protein insertase
MVEIWNGLLHGLGAILSFFYDVIPNYGVAIILLTIFVRLLLLPLTIKQTRSMQGMQQIQPKVKELQRKYKGNRQKLNEELMKLYKEHQVNPLGGCLPLLLQLPVFFALYRVLRGFAPGAAPGTFYLPEGSLKTAIEAGGERFLGMNLACSPAQAGHGMVPVVPGAPLVDCGSGFGSQFPFYLMVVLMVATTFYQQRQMQKVSSGPQASQMKLMTTIMPVFLGFISIQIAAGVLVYWVTTNAWQVVQQRIMLKKRQESTVVAKALPKDASKDPPVSKDGKVSGNGSDAAQVKKSNQQGNRNAGSRKKRRKR